MSGPRGSTGGYNSHHIGGHTTNHGGGWCSTTDNTGTIGHYCNSDNRGSSWGRGGGNGGSRSGTNHSAQSRMKNVKEMFRKPDVLPIFGVTAAYKNTPVDGYFKSANPTPVFAVAGVGSMAVADASFAASFRAALGALVGSVGVGFAIASIFHSSKVGIDSDKVPGRENFVSVTLPGDVLNLPDSKALQECKTVDMSVRGIVTVEKDSVEITAVKLPTPEPVPVLHSKIDQATNLFVHDVPTGEKIATMPTSIPFKGPYIRPIEDLPVRVHNAGAVPMDFTEKDRDYVIAYPPDSKIEPIYVMLNSTRKGQLPKGQSYHPVPETKDITAFPDLVPQRRKNPVQGGGGLRARWKDSKGRSIYEWDSIHGELEKYRASDGKHLGAFDPKTGKENEGPNSRKDLDKKCL